MTGLLLAAILAPLAASIASLITGWRRTTATLTALSATTVLACAVAMGFWMGSGAQFGLGGLLRADALTVVMLVVIGSSAHWPPRRASATSTPSWHTGISTDVALGCMGC